MAKRCDSLTAWKIICKFSYTDLKYRTTLCLKEAYIVSLKVVQVLDFQE